MTSEGSVKVTFSFWVTSYLLFYPY
jgi:hypothetical protein